MLLSASRRAPCWSRDGTSGARCACGAPSSPSSSSPCSGYRLAPAPPSATALPPGPLPWCGLSAWTGRGFLSMPPPQAVRRRERRPNRPPSPRMVRSFNHESYPDPGPHRDCGVAARRHRRAGATGWLHPPGPGPDVPPRGTRRPDRHVTARACGAIGPVRRPARGARGCRLAVDYRRTARGGPRRGRGTAGADVRHHVRRRPARRLHGGVPDPAATGPRGDVLRDHGPGQRRQLADGQPVAAPRVRRHGDREPHREPRAPQHGQRARGSLRAARPPRRGSRP